MSDNFHVTYLVLQCFYTDRLLKHVDKMQPRPIFICEDRLTTYEECTEYDWNVMKICFSNVAGKPYGTICFKYVGELPSAVLIDTIKMLQSFEHRAYFYIDKPYPTRRYTDYRRCVTDEDLYAFEDGNETYYHGTLNSVTTLPGAHFTLLFLQFVAASGF